MKRKQSWMRILIKIFTGKAEKMRISSFHARINLIGVPSAYEKFVSIRNRFKNFAVILRRDRRVPDGGRQGAAHRRLVPRRRLVRDGVQDRRLTGAEKGCGTSAAGHPGADHGR